MRTEAYKLLIQMKSFFPVTFPLQMLVQDVTETENPDFNLINQALLAVFHLPIQNSMQDSDSCGSML